MLAILPGQPAKGERQPQNRGPQDYPNLSPQQREKLLAALQKQQPAKAETPVGWAKTEVCISTTVHSACPGSVKLQLHAAHKLYAIWLRQERVASCSRDCMLYGAHTCCL